MSFDRLLIHSTDVYTKTETNTAGRISETWTRHGPIPCRFSSPNTTRVSPVAGTSFEQIDATIYTGPELLDIVAGSDLPVRFTTVYPGWAGTYELRTRPRMICGETSPVHHYECDVTEVQT